MMAVAFAHRESDTHRSHGYTHKPVSGGNDCSRLLEVELTAEQAAVVVLDQKAERAYLPKTVFGEFLTMSEYEALSRGERDMLDTGHWVLVKFLDGMYYPVGANTLSQDARRRVRDAYDGMR